MSGMQAYAYLRPSLVEQANRRVRLETAGGMTAAGPAAHPRLFAGFLAGPE
jgi:hypothetical protein